MPRMRQLYKRLWLAAFAACFLVDRGVAQEASGPDEDAAIQSTGGLARRIGNDLHLTLENKKEKILTTRNKCGQNGTELEYENCIYYVLQSYDPQRHAFIIWVQLYESRSFEWIESASGRSIPMASEPHVSPSGSRIAVVSASVAEESDNIIQIWRYKQTDKSIYKEWEYDPLPDGFFDYDSWQSDTIVSLHRHINYDFQTNLPARLVFGAPDHPGWDLQFDDRELK